MLTDARADYSARGEAALLRSGRTPLRPVFAAPHLTVYEVPRATPILTGPPGARVVSLTESRIVVSARGPASYRLAVRFSRYWQPSAGCATRNGDGMIRLSVPRPGRVDAEVRTERPERARRAGRPFGPLVCTRLSRLARVLRRALIVARLRRSRWPAAGPGSTTTPTPETVDRQGRAAAEGEGQRRRRQAGVRDRRLQELPHAEGRGRDGHGRAEPRRGEAARRPGRRPGDERQGRDAVLQRPAHARSRSPTSPRTSRRSQARQLILPDDFPRGRPGVRLRPRPHADLEGRGAAAADTGGDRRGARGAGIHVILVTGRMFQSVRPYAEAAGIDDPVVCYQGAVVADPVSGRFLRHEPIPLELAREAIAAVEAEGYPLNCYVGRRALRRRTHDCVARRTPRSRTWRCTRSATLLAWLKEPPTKLVAVGDPDELDGLEQRMRAHFGGRLYISKSLPHFLEFASPEVTKGSGLAFLAEHLGFDGRRDGRLRRRRERRRAARVGRLRGRGRERARAGAGGRRLRLPAVRRGGRGAGDRGVPGPLEHLAVGDGARHDRFMWWRCAPGAPKDDINPVLARWIMRMDAKLDEILDLLKGDDETESEP